MKTFLQVTILLATFLLASSCDKYQAKRLSGTYKCEVEYSYWDMTPTNIDSTYAKEIEITRDGKDLIVLGNSIHIDKLKDGQEYYEGSVHEYIKVTFNKRNKTILIQKHSGGQGGGSSTEYFGTKE